MYVRSPGLISELFVNQGWRRLGETARGAVERASTSPATPIKSRQQGAILTGGEPVEIFVPKRFLHLVEFRNEHRR